MLRKIVLLAAASLLPLAVPRPAKAVLNYYIYESGTDVILETRGSLTLPKYVSGRDSCAGNLDPAQAILCTGSSGMAGMFTYYAVGPSSLSNGTTALNADSVSGINTQLLSNSTAEEFAIDYNYVLGKTPGGQIISEAIFNNKSLSDFGFTAPAGTLLGTWVLQKSPFEVDLYTAYDKINVFLGPPPGPGSQAPVPSPLPWLGASAAFGWSRRLRRRVALNEAAATLRPEA